jgi:outer membrane cobalamin receptor
MATCVSGWSPRRASERSALSRSHGLATDGTGGCRSVLVRQRVELRSAAYLGWRLPTLNELFRPFRAGSDAVAANPLLEPERLRGAEIGADWRRGAASLSLTAFANRLRAPIANVTLGTGPGTFPGVGFVAAGGSYRQRRNLDRIDVTGLEVAGAVTRGPWQLAGSLQLADARVGASGPRRRSTACVRRRPHLSPREPACAGSGMSIRLGCSCAIRAAPTKTTSTDCRCHLRRRSTQRRRYRCRRVCR